MFFVARVERDIGFGGYRKFLSRIEDDEAVVEKRRKPEAGCCIYTTG